MTDNLYRKLRRLVIIFFVAMIALFAFVIEESYQGRQGVVDAARRACERGKLDRRGSITLGSGTLFGFHQTDQRLGGHPTPKRIQAETNISEAISSFASRTGNNLNCKTAFPHASILPWEGR